MAVLDNFKNFIRHGKTARDGNGTDLSASSSGAHLSNKQQQSLPPLPTQQQQSSQAESSELGMPNSRSTAGFSAQAPNLTESGYQGVEKGAPADGKKNHHSSGNQAGPSAHGMTAAENASTTQAHVNIGNQDLGSTGAAGTPLLSTEAQMFSKEAEKIVEEERVASEKMPSYPGLSERFQLICKMGDGAFSNVYKARYHKSGQKVAIKVVRKYELNSNQRANILKEVQIMRNLKHDGIVKLLEFSESRDHYYLILELLEGGELFHQIVKLTYFSEALARHVILQVAHGIRYLHEERGIVHRDIKPENLLFESIKIIPSKINKARPYDEEKEDEGEFMPDIGGGGIGKVKIADFGLSKIVWEESTMTPCGTVGYTAPEIVKDERYSKSVDMWALGCVLYTLLCGFPPFYDESISVLTEKVAKGYYTFLSPWWDDISGSAKDLITHLLCVDTSKRFTIDEFLAHPWCNVKDPVPDLNSADIALAKASEMPLDSPLLQSMKKGNSARQAMMSPGINQLKEAFDVTYAVHRMEEEGAHRRGAGGQENLRGVALNEDDEDEEDVEQIQSAARKRGETVSPPRNEREYHQQQQQRHQHNSSTSSTNSSSAQQQQTAAQQYPGRGGADRKMAEAALYDGRAGTRDRGSAARNKKQFELNMGNATLLGRRNRGNPDGSIAQMLDHGNSHSTNFAPGSPMRVD